MKIINCMNIQMAEMLYRTGVQTVWERWVGRLVHAVADD